MKSKNVISKMPILALCFAALGAVPAYSANPAHEGDALVGQVGVTQDALQQVLARLRESSSSANGAEFSNPDFLAKAQAFNAQVEQAMVRFEGEMKVILKQAVFYHARLQAILKSTAYSPEQKKALFDSQFSAAEVALKELSVKYHRSLTGLYLLGFPETQIQFDSKFCSAKEEGENNYSYIYINPRLESQSSRLHDQVQ